MSQAHVSSDIDRINIKRSGTSTHIRAYAGIDTVEILARNIPRGLRKLAERHRIALRVADVFARQGWHMGWRICLNRVPYEALDEIGETCAGRLIRADIGVAIMGVEPEAGLGMVKRHVRQKYSRLPAYDDEFGTFYGARPGSARQLVAYADRAKRYLTASDDPCLWMELRLTSPVLRRMEINRVKELKGINPRSLFCQSIRWTDGECRKRLERVMRKYCKNGYERQRYMGVYKRMNMLGDGIDDGIQLEDFLSWIPEKLFIERKGFFGHGM